MPNPKKSESTLTTVEVARILDMTPDDVAVLARKGILRGRKSGRQWRFTRRDVGFLAKRLKPQE